MDPSSATPPIISSTSPLDIGVLIKSGHLRTIDDSAKLKVIRLTPDEKFHYPVKYMHGCNRRFKPEWAKKHPWLHYSQTDDGAYCKACVLFAPADVKQQKLGILVAKPFCVWTKQSSSFNDHEKLKYHQDSMARMTAFKDSCSDPTKNVATMLNKAREEQVSRNTRVIKSLLKCVIFCGKQGIAFRGHRDDSTSNSATNMGNFIELVTFRAENDDTLRQYLETSPMNALYTSKTIQNEMIELVGNAVQDRIIKEVNEAKFFTILADEVTDCSNVEQVSLVIRFVDNDKNIREDFLGFLAVECITGECLATELLCWLQSHHIDVAFCRGQGYDGASNMSSSISGVQARIRSVSPLAFYTHCQSHQLNLCVVKACSIPQIRNASGVISEISKFFNYSPKRQHFFEHIIQIESPNETKTKLKDLCRTRWVQRIDSYTVFYDLYPCIIKTMEAISLAGGTSEWSWDSETLTKARGFLHQLLSFQFLITFYVTMTVLSSLRILTVKLQKKSNDILAAYDLVGEVITNLELLKTNCEEEFHLWYTEILTLADKFDIIISTPRTASRQAHRSNIPADTVEAYYRRNLVVPFLDHITTELTTRFIGSNQQTKVKLLGLIPSIATTYPNTSVTDVGELYKADLPSPHLLLPEFRRWKNKYSSVPLANRPTTLQTALQSCEKDDFPNIFILLLIACTLPVTTCETERSNSQLKLLKTYLRSTMTETRLSSLALIKIHRDIVSELDYDKLVLDFANKHPRRMALPCIFS